MKKNFTLVELLTVIGIIIILAGLLLPAVQRARAKGQMAHCLSNQRQLMQGALIYANDWKQHLPYTSPGGSGGDNERQALGNREYVQIDSNRKEWWKYEEYWAYKIKNTLNSPGSFFYCISAKEDTNTNNFSSDSHARDYLLSYEVCFEVSRRKVSQVLNADSAIYAYENNKTSNLAQSRYFTAGHNSTPNKNISKLIWKENGGTSDNLKDYDLAHRGRMNVVFVDGHAEAYSWRDMLTENVLAKPNSRELRSDYEYIWYQN